MVKLKNQMELTAKKIGKNSKESKELVKQYIVLQNKIVSLKDKQRKNIEEIRETSKRLKEQFYKRYS